MESEIPPVQQIRLKVEINCYEHFNVLGLTKVPFSVSNKWFSGSCEITTYHLDELIGTKIRALYQRKKGRDLYDLQIALQQKDINVDNVLKCYNAYMEFVVEMASWGGDLNVKYVEYTDDLSKRFEKNVD